jgi:hypothetical protein
MSNTHKSDLDERLVTSVLLPSFSGPSGDRRGDRPTVTIDLAINRTMQIYAMITDHLTFSMEQLLRAQLTSFLHAQIETDEMRLTVAGLTFLRKLSKPGIGR